MFFFQTQLGSDFCYPCDAPNLSKFRLVASCTELGVKNQILESFTSSNATLRAVIATIAFGLGVHCPDIRQIIHLGPPEDVKAYLQATGRAGRDGKSSIAVLLKKKPRHSVDKAIQEYLDNDINCRRETLFRDFQSYSSSSLISKCDIMFKDLYLC